jgi:N utilization substance protein B
MQVLYALEFHGEKSDVFSYVMNEFGDDVPDDSFARKIFEGVSEYRDELDKIIKKAAPEWPLEKIALMDLTILRIGVYEIMYNDEVPDLVAINEAIEITKEYGGYNNSKFINGVLSNVMHSKDSK